MVSNNLKTYAKQAKEASAQLNRDLILKVVGVTFEGRQEVLKDMTTETPVKLVRERRNKYDSKAVAVFVELAGVWKQAGYLPRQATSRISKHLDNGETFPTTVHRLLGGMENPETGETYSYGLEVRITP